MAGLIKKQILKHLSRFAKNLSPDKINLSTLKGEGQLTNLELDEEVLQNMLDLPTWLAINKVCCNKASIRIPWTKLKTHPITLSLDKVVMEMSTCDEPRPPNGPSPIATASGQSEYGFAEKVVEGISLSINSIVIRISAKAFNASFELSQLQVYSVNTSWVVSDLRYTRIQDPTFGEILTFKEVSWQMIRIEADAIQSSEHEVVSAPIRLITNQSRIRVTLKRRTKDCNVVASKLVLILDDLLWVLTDSQLKAMVQYAKSLSEAMEKSAMQRKSMAPDSSQIATASPSVQQVHTQQALGVTDPSASMACLFNTYNVCETSHHLQITHLDLHICDDIHSKDRGINQKIEGGAMQLSFSSITMDYYPFHRAGESCLHWVHYSDATKTREGWAHSLLEEFRSNVDMLKTAVSGQAPGSPLHGKISTGVSSTFVPPAPRSQLMTSSVVLRMSDFSIYQVSTADQRRTSPKAMISCNKKTLYLPQEMPAVHAEFTEYYFPDGKDYPIPCPNLYVQLNALQLVVDPRSLVWLNLFALDLRHSLEQFMQLYKLNDSQKPDEHVDVRVDGLMLKLVVPAEQEQPQPDIPRSISVQTSEMVATNTRHPSTCSRSSLEALLQAFQEQAFFTSSSFPRGPASFPVLHPVFRRHAHEQDTRVHDVYRGLTPPSLSAHALKASSATDLWALHFSQFWVDYEGARDARGRPAPCVDSFPLTLWICQPARYAQHQQAQRASAGPLSRADSAGRLQRKKLLKEYYSAEGSPSLAPPTNGLPKPLSLDGLSVPAAPSLPASPAAGEPDVHVLVHVRKPLSVQVSHAQGVFLLQLQRAVTALQRTLQQDLERHGLRRQPSPSRSFAACVAVLMRSAEVALLLRPGAQAQARAATATGSPPGSGPSPAGSEGGSDAGERPPASHPLAATSEEKTAEREGSAAEPQAQQGEATPGKAAAAETTSEPPSRNCTDKSQGARLPQSMSSGRLMRDRSQSNFSVSYKNMKSPSLQSLDSISIDSYLLEDGDGYSMLEKDDMSISGFKATLCESSVPEQATEALMQDGDDSQSPDAVSATSQSTDEPTKDMISVLVLKAHSVCTSLDVRGDSTALALEVGQVRPNHLGNISLRQYLSNRSLRLVTPQTDDQSSEGSVSEQDLFSEHQTPEVRLRLESGPEAAAHSPLAERNGFLQCHLQAFNADFLMTTLRNLSVFLEDDSTSQVLPMEIMIKDTHVNLKDDGPQDNSSEPEPSTMALHIHNLLVLRKDDGSFHIGVERAAEAEPQKAGPVTDSRLSSVPEVPMAVATEPKATQTAPLSPTSPIPTSREKLLIEENECLKVELSKTKMALAEAQMEKDSLLHRMKSLKLNSGGSIS
ncbi:UHRF1-binding protein 1-like isoform X4 [Electrophorus electricus]|uniref:UHRF1-binding protein 1-like isoform X3 n=1 Tax=Electrophorus electricus TaxID=8005 RepID=UPI0015D0614B|nr:UHRF1-binding protein 1-like isoform X3 [Electrophorus electricus]XP_035377763.1 UHRF1-binding protein 1-like isoform X3 [Electrophorus electricus]XP_035377769.1 UHRF1-binding protein 1-like isoform X4 [Electrophorus electricus]